MNFAARLPLVLFALFFAGLSGFMSFQIRRAQNEQLGLSARAKAVPAIVTSSAMHDRSETITDDSGATRQATLYSAQVQFSYDVNGKTYVSDRWGVSQGETSDRQSVQAIVDRFKPGLKTTAYADPSNPGTAVLERHVDFSTFGLLLFLSVFMLIGSQVFCLAFLPTGYQIAQNQVIELVFDLPCALWFLFCGYQFICYYTWSSAPYSMFSYLAAGGIFLVTAVVVHMRLIGHGVLRPLGRMQTIGVAPQMQSSPGGAPSMNGGWTNMSAGGGPGRGAWQASPMIQARVSGSRTTPLAGVIQTVVLICFIGFPAFNMYRAMHQRDTRNPERTTVYSKENAIQQISAEDEKVKNQADNPWAYKQRGINYFDAEMYDKAIPDLTYTLSKHMDDQTLWCRARCYLLTKQYDKALQDYEQLNKIGKNARMHYVAQRGIGICAYHLAKYQMAVDAFTEALQSLRADGQEKQELYHDRALSYFKLGKQDLAEADLKSRGNDVSNYWLMDERAK